MSKPEWWPENPYPEDIFVMRREQYPEAVSDPALRTALSGMLGRLFWDLASDAYWAAVEANIPSVLEQLAEAGRGVGEECQHLQFHKVHDLTEGSVYWECSCGRKFTITEGYACRDTSAPAA